jgi:hypothetical protein
MVGGNVEAGAAGNSRAICQYGHGDERGLPPLSCDEKMVTRDVCFWGANALINTTI